MQRDGSYTAYTFRPVSELSSELGHALTQSLLLHVGYIKPRGFSLLLSLLKIFGLAKLDENTLGRAHLCAPDC